MYLHADQVPEGTILSGFDICIVGAGAAGIAMAQRLAHTTLKVILLVSGAPGDRGAAIGSAPIALSRHGRRVLCAKSIPSFPSARGSICLAAPPTISAFGRVRWMPPILCRVRATAMPAGLSSGRINALLRRRP